jgi:hypothetical protein
VVCSDLPVGLSTEECATFCAQQQKAITRHLLLRGAHRFKLEISSLDFYRLAKTKKAIPLNYIDIANCHNKIVK